MKANDLLEAMSFVDEQYIAEADMPLVRKKNYWTPILAMAACLSLVLLGLRSWLPAMKTAQTAVEEAVYAEKAIPERAIVKSALKTQSAPMNMDIAIASDTGTASTSHLRFVTVRVTKVEESTLTAVIAAPGPMEEGTEVTIHLPQEEEPIAVNVGDLLNVSYHTNPEDDTILDALSIAPAEE